MQLLVQSSCVIVLFVVIVAAADVKPCCGPTKWTADVIQTVGMYIETTVTVFTIAVIQHQKEFIFFSHD